MALLPITLKTLPGYFLGRGIGPETEEHYPLQVYLPQQLNEWGPHNLHVEIQAAPLCLSYEVRKWKKEEEEKMQT